MWREAALFAVLVSGFVLSIGIRVKEGRADDPHDQDRPSAPRMSDVPPSHALRLLRRIGFQSPDRLRKPPVTAVSATEELSRPTAALVSDELPSVSDARTALPVAFQGAIQPIDRTRPLNKLRAAQSTAPDRVGTTVGPDQQTENPLRASEAPATSRPAMLTFSDGGSPASKSRLEHGAEPTREAKSVDGPAKVHLDDGLQSRSTERPVAAAAQFGGTEEEIPVFKIGSSSRRTARLRTVETTLAGGPDPGERKAASATPSDSLPPKANPLRSAVGSGTYLRPQFVRPLSPPSAYHSDQPLVTSSPTLPGEYRRSGWQPRADQTAKRATVDKAEIQAQVTRLQPQSTIVSKVGTTPSLSERSKQNIALALNATSSGLAQPYLRREASLRHESVPTDEENAPLCLPKTTRQNRLPSTPAAAPVNALRNRPAVASVSKQPQITAPKLLPKEEPQAEIRPLPVSSPSLRLAVRESRMVRSPKNIVRVASANAEVCEVVLLNARDVAVVGKSRGTTSIEFWYDNRGISRASHTVAVGPERTLEAPKDDRNQEVQKLISYLFPDSQVELISEEDRLIVRGRTVSRRRAIDILSTIRRSQLVPVVDELVVQDD